MKRIISLFLALLLVVGLTACGGNPISDESKEESKEESGEATSTETSEQASTADNKGLKICIVSSSGVDDGSFTQSVYRGIQSFVKNHPDCSVTDVKEPDLSKLIGVVASVVGDYDVIVCPGFNLAAVGDIAKDNADKTFIVVDTKVTDSEGNPVEGLPNVYTMTFKEEEGGFLAGLAAALVTKTGKVSEVNGIAFPSNVNYQFGFMAGVNYANKAYGTKAEFVEIPSYAGQAAVEVKGMGKNVGGNYVGDFADEATGKEVAKALINQGCDVLFPAAGASGNGVFTAVKEADGVFAIGCDIDQYDDGANGDGNIILTSALKVMDKNVEKQLNALYDGTFEGKDELLGADSDSIGYVKEEGRHQLPDDVIQKIDETFAKMKAGDIVPPSNFNGYLPDDFPGLK